MKTENIIEYFELEELSSFKNQGKQLNKTLASRFLYFIKTTLYLINRYVKSFKSFKVKCKSIYTSGRVLLGLPSYITQHLQNA